MHIHIREIVSKAEAFYREKVDYENGVKVFEKEFPEVREKLRKKRKTEVSIPETLSCIVNSFKDKHVRHMVVIEAFKLEEEVQKSEFNKENWELMVKIILEELTEFYLGDGEDIEIMTIDQFEKAFRKKSVLEAMLTIFFLNSWIYYPLSLPFQLIHILFIICLVIKPVFAGMKHMVNTGEQLNIMAVIRQMNKKMPRIFKNDYWYHHLIIGVLLWTLILLYINK